MRPIVLALTVLTLLVVACVSLSGCAATPHQTCTVELRGGSVRTFQGYRLAAWTEDDGYAATLWVAETRGRGRLLYAIDRDSVLSFAIESRKPTPR